MTSAISYEFKRIFTGNSLIAYAVIVIASLYFTFQGVTEYKRFSEYKSDFLASERDKINLYINYEQYGAAGFRVILEPSTLSVFFNRFDFTRDLKARIDTSEIISLYNSRKGKKAFLMGSRFGDLNQSIMIFGTLIMIILGFHSFPNRFHIEYFSQNHYIKTILIRLLLLNIFFALLLLVNFIGAGFLSVTFSKEEITCFIWYSVCALIILSTSFLVGLLINSICKYKKNAIQILMIIWFIFIFVLPEINKVYRSIKSSSLPSEEKLDIEKLSTLLDSEYNIKLTISNHLSKRKLNSQQDIQEYQKLLKSLLQNYIHNGYAQNKNKENNFLQEVKRDMEIFSYLNIIFPVDFLSHISAEISGEGFSAYIHFFEYIVKLKDNFLQFYSQKRAETISTPNQSGVESFIQNTDNVYQTKSRLPENFIWGVMIMIIYFIILLFLIHFSQKKVKKIPGVIGVTETYKPGFILFLLVNKKKQDEVVNSFKQGKRKFLHRTSHLILNKEVTGRNFVNYACHEKEIERHKVIANIKSLGITEDDLNVKISKLTEEKKRKIICALIFAEEGDCFVINDFIKGASYEFEKQFLELVSQEVNLKRKIIYIGTEIYTPGSSLIKWDIKIDTYQRFHLDPKKISLR